MVMERMAKQQRRKRRQKPLPQVAGEEDLLRRMSTGEIDIDDLEGVESTRPSREPVRGWAKVRRILTPVTRRDAEIIRHFFQYLKPHLFKVGFAVLLSIVAGGMVLGQLFLIEHGLSVLDPQSSPRPAQKSHGPGGLPMLQRSPTVDAPERFANLDHDFTLVAGQDVSDAARRQQLLLVVAGIIGLALFTALLKYIQGVTMSSVSRLAARRIREDAFRNLVRLPLRFHQTTHSGKLMARLIKDIDRLRTLLVSLSLGITTQLAAFLGALAYALSKTSVAAIFALCFVVLALVPIRVIADKIRHKDKSAEAGAGDLFAIAAEAIAGQKVVKSFTAEGHETRRFNEATRSMYEKQMVTYRLRAMTEPLVDVVAGIGVAAGFWFLGTMVIDGRLDFPVLATVLIALQRLAASVRRMGKMQNDLARGVAAADRVDVLLTADTEKDLQDENAMPFRELKDKIEFRGVRFGYDSDSPILQDIDLTIRRGETVAIVGPSGAGKTTLVDLLPRFFNVDDGTILIDDCDTRLFKLRSLRSQIGIVSQETMLFRDTIRENIAYGLKDADDAAVTAAAKAAHAHDFIMAKAKGYDTPLGERGSRLSGGERQRLAIARAILKDPPILILDEATSSLDAEAEAEVQRALENLMQGRTTLVIAHRLATVRRADRIVVLKHGTIAEEGTHAELMALGGHYARAYRLQSEAITRGDEARPMDDFFEEEPG